MKTADYLEATQQVEKGKIAPLYVFLGSGFFLKDRLLRSLAKVFLGETGELRRLDLEEGTEGVWEDSGSICLFARRRILYLKGLQSLKAKERSDFLRQMPPHCPDDLIVLEYAEDSGEGLKELTEKEGVFVKDPIFNEERLKGFVRRSFAARGQEIEEEAMEYLLAHAGRTLEFLQGEVEKVSLYADAGQPIDRPLVEKALFPSEEGAAYTLVDAIVAGRAGQALELLKIFLEHDKGSVGSLLYLLFRQFRLLLQVADVPDRKRADPALLAQRMGVHPFQVKKALASSRYTGHTQALAALAELAEIDTRIKRGGEDPVFLLERFIVRLAGEVTTPIS
jgi:DNA polymerase-3 subunit delta